MLIGPDGISFQAVDPMRMALIKMMLPAKKLSLFKTDINVAFQFNIADLMDDMSGAPTGHIYLEIKDGDELVIKTSYYTTTYSISPLGEDMAPLSAFKDDMDDISVPVPPAIMEFVRLLKRRGIDKITMKQDGEKLRLVGKGDKRTYTTALEIQSPPKKFGTTSVSVLWLADILGTMSEVGNISFCFSSLSNLYLRDDNDYFISEAVLAGTVKKITVPGDLPSINTESIDEEASAWEW